VRVMRHVDGQINEKWLGAMIADVRFRLIENQIGKVAAIEMHALIVFPEIVAIGAIPIEKVRVIVDATAHETEGIIETMIERSMAGGVTQVPFANVGGVVAGVAKNGGDGHFVGRKTRAREFVELIVSFGGWRRAILGHSREPRITTRQ